MNKEIILALFITAGAMLVGGLIAIPVIQEAEASVLLCKDPGGPDRGPGPICRDPNNPGKPIGVPPPHP